MKTLLVFCVAAGLGIGTAHAQTAQGQPSGSTTQAPAKASETGNPAVKSPSANSDKTASTTSSGTVPLASLESGANSFTEGQARSRLQDAGFGNVTELAKDDKGIWRGKAQRNGKAVTVGLDYKGNIGSE